MNQSEQIEYKSNFDWNITNRKLVVFMPNYKYNELTEFSILMMKTKLKSSDYIIIIGNDNIDVNWDHLKDYNVRYFTLLRSDKNPRNGLFIRNYIIKRCQSKIFLQKDGEVVLLGDFMYNAVYFNLPWRAGRISVLDKENTKSFMETKDELSIPITKTIEMIIAEDSTHAKQIILDAGGRVNYSSYFHYAFAIHTDILQYIRGYDEDFKLYGWEDSDLFCRLFQIGYYLVPDYSCIAVHLYHPKEPNISELASAMKKIFLTKSPQNPKRNIYWGMGI